MKAYYSRCYPLILDYRGATISRMRLETGADIQVGKEDDLITITGGTFKFIYLNCFTYLLTCE